MDVKTGRNDPCPCGSGKKYKNCCLAADDPGPQRAPAVDAAAERRARTRTTALRALLAFADRPEFAEAFAEALESFGGGPDGGDASLGEHLRVKFAFFYLFDHLLPGGRTIAEEYLARPGQPMPLSQQQVIRRLSTARLRPYEVVEVRVDEGLRLLDLRTNEEIVVAERAATHQLHRFDVLVARVSLEEDGLLRVDGDPYLLPVASKARLLKAVKAEERRLRRRGAPLDDDLLLRHCAPLFHRLWLDEVVRPPMPEIVTDDGDPMIFGKVVFDVLDAAALRSALDAHPALRAAEDERYVWIEEEPDFTRGLGHLEIRDDGRLVLEVASRRRAERGRSLLEEAAGAALRYRSTRFESVARAIEDQRAAPAEAAEAAPVAPEVVAGIINEYKDRHYRTWPDEPLPALDGRTPRAAARTVKLRARLVDLLKEMENHERRASRPGAPPYDFGWIWAELRLDRPR